MSYPDLGENTLGVILGKRRGQAGTASPTRALRQARAMGASLGTGYLGVGAGVIAGLQMLYGLTLLVWNWDLYPDTLPVALAWLVLLACLGGVAISVATQGESMPDWLFFVVVIGIFVVIALDFIAIWPLDNIAAYATASACAGCGLLISVTLRREWEIILVAGLIAIVFIVALGAVGSNIAREIPPHQVEVFEGYVHGQELSVNGVTTNIWYKDHIGFAWAGLFTEVKTDGLPDLTPRPQLAANQRRVGPLGAKARTEPRVEDNVARVALGGTVEVFLGYVHGESVDGNDIWYVDDRHFLWSGGFETQDVLGLPNLTVVTAPPPPAPPVEEVTFPYLSGIDVARYQEAAALNVLPTDFYIIKATEGGADWQDEALASNLAEARVTGKPVAFYHFAHPLVTEANTAGEEARSFLAAIKPHLQKGDRVALDWEAENQDRTDWAEEWLNIVAEATRSTPWIYLNSKAINDGDWSKVEAKYPLWYAGGLRYGSTIEGFIPVPLAEARVTWAAGVDLWQYTAHGRLRGYEGDLDFNILYISEEQWRAGGAEGPMEEPVPNPPLEEPAPPLTNDPDDSLREFADWLFQSFKDRDR